MMIDELFSLALHERGRIGGKISFYFYLKLNATYLAWASFESDWHTERI